MKQYILFSLMGAAALLSACNEDFNEDVADPQAWPQEEAVTIPGFSVSAVASNDLAKAGEKVAVFSYTQPSGMPEGTTIENFRLDITPEGVADAKTTQLKADENGQVSTAELQALIEEAYGKRPTERTLNAKVYANLMKEGQASLLTCDPIVIKATPKAPFISNGYYLIGNMNGWSADAMFPFSHSDADVYDDPVFTLMFSTTGDNQYWKIIPQSNVDGGDVWAGGETGVVGVEVDGDSSLSGKLITDNPQAGKIEKAGMYIMTLNMMDYTYSIKEVAPEYFIVGAMQDWNNNPATGKTCMLYPTTAMIQSYTTKFVGDANLKLWLNSDFGTWSACFGAAVNGATDETGAIVSSNSGAIVCPEKDAFYTFTADFSTMTYTWTKLENQEPAEYEFIELLGGFNGWPGNDVKGFVMTQVKKAPHNWYSGEFVLDADTELKFRANANWSVNWGADVDVATDKSGQATQNGSNIKVPAGTYNVYFNDITGQFVFVTVE
ncbi:MAG: DUF5115 domain-containing protein [Bacteroides sp.]